MGSRRVRAARGLTWIVDGWACVARMPRAAVALSAILLGATLPVMALASPRIGGVVLGVLMIFYLAIISTYCQLLERGAPRPRLRDQRAILGSKALWTVAAVAGAATLALDLLSNTMGVYARAASWSGLGLYFLFVKIMSLLAMMALWLAPTLIVQDGAGALRAMKLSLLATLGNILPWLLFSVLAFVFCIVAVIPLGLGLLAALPTLACAARVARRDLVAVVISKKLQ